MKRSMSVLLSLLLIAALSACAPKGTPTPSVADLQATAMANAKAQIALTAASVPTATPLPPTPMPTPIPVQPTAILQPQIVAPTQPVVIVAPAAGSSSGDPCNVPLSKMKGPHVEVTFKNTTKGDLSFYLYIYENAFGCGIGNVNIAPLESVTTSLPKGCYDFYGWVNGPKNSTPAGNGCLNFNQTVIVGQDNVVFQDQKK